MAPKTKETKNLPAKKAAAGALSTEVLDMFVDDAGKGMEGADGSCFAIPFLTILQSGSPQCKKSNLEKFIKGAEEGMLFNTLTKEVYNGEEEGLLFVPCAFDRKMVAWVPKDDGGGFRGSYSPSEAPKTFREDKHDCFKDDEGNTLHLVDTRYHYGFYIKPDGSAERAVIAMASSQLKVSKNWMSLMDNLRIDGPNGKFCPPTFSHMYRLKSVPTTDGENTWCIWVVELEGPVTDRGMYEAAKLLNKQVREGVAKAVEPEDDAATTNGSF